VKEICIILMAKCFIGHKMTKDFGKDSRHAFWLWVELEATNVFLVCPLWLIK
jgi:hypothetical protein